MVILKILLLPFAILFKLATNIRNKLFDLGLKPSVTFDIPTISIGNLTVGGTGKTPMVEHLSRLYINKNIKPSTLSRGYGRKTKGMRIAGENDDASTLGDEPFQFYKKFLGKVTVAVGEDRVYAIPNIIDQHPDTDVIILDDAYQHRYVRPLFNVLLTDFNRPFYSDYLLPMGRLRESRTGADRADVVIVTKCPSAIPGEEMIEIEKKIKRYTNKRVFFSKIRYGFPIPFSTTKGELSNKVILISGIANPSSLEDYVKHSFELIKHINFRDHHQYKAPDLQEILDIVRSNPGVSVLTTEKDMVKMDIAVFSALNSQVSLFYLPIEVEFLKNGEDFDEMMLNVLNQANDK